VVTTEGTRSEGRSARVTLRVFAVISAIFALTEIAAVYSAAQARSSVRRTVSAAVSRVELVTRMGHAVDRERILVNAHIFEKNVNDMSALEARVADVERRFDQDAGRLAEMDRDHPIEPDTMASLLDAVASVRREIRPVMALSMVNRDEEAFVAMERVDARFDAIDGILSRLVHATEMRSETAAQRTSSVQLASIAISSAFSFAALAASIALGMWASGIVGERERAAVRYANDLEQRNRDLDAFAARVAHDLRGPLTTIGLAGARLAEMLPNERGTAQLFSRGVSRMEALIADLLALSRIASQASRGRCDPAEIAAQVREDLAPLAARAQAKLQYDVARAAIACSPVLFRQVLTNLVENGVKYRRPGGEAEVSVAGRTSGREYVLTVRDNGIGMEPDVAQKIFQPFFRSPRVGHVAGTGLGLSIVKRIVDASDATIAVQSTPGAGTTFTLRFALADDLDEGHGD
jgi:signal transduction histidine kinase